MLSGSAYIGQLYDAKLDQIIHDRFLWNSPIPFLEAPITSVRTKTTIEQTVKDRRDTLDVSASLSASLMAGMLKVITVCAQDLTSLENNPLLKINWTASKEYRQTSKKCQQFKK